MYGHPEFDLYEAIYTTRSMRRLKPDPVAPELIVKVVEAATMGPSGGNRQPWKFVIVRDADTKAFVAERYMKAWSRYFTGKARALVENDPQHPQSRILRSAKYLAEHIADVPVMLFGCVKRYTDTGREGQPMFNAIFPAIQNLCLAARGYGLGTSLTGLHMRYGDEINARLGVPEEYANVALIPMGYPKGRWDRPARRPALEVTYWEKWGNASASVPAK
ncbi:MAG TPA: nitroreductase family protein [Candidatus Binataceae bacterium]|nr:nitroreductase family protein [Candidatus Binataceae bacterium]